jgi:hypothetical protein
VLGLTLAEFTALRTEIAADPRGRRAILKARKLTPLKWRELEQAWADEISQRANDPREIKALLTGMRDAAGAR